MIGDWALLVLAVALALYAGAALITVALPQRALGIVYPVCVLAAILSCAADLSALIGNADLKATLPLGLPGTGLRFRLDALSAFFGLIVNLGIAAASVYGLGIGRSGLSKRIETYYPAFCAAMNVVLLADDAFAFLFFWELMSLSSWALVIARHEDEECRKAAYVYLIMAA
ncbi:MAG: hydrogenase 4 subunit B, partial [Rhodomicrobium sp.]|nr:hydrogenase 4 subunit B [Rhodomicrobium sp.]